MLPACHSGTILPKNAFSNTGNSRVRWSRSGTEYGKHKSLNEGKGRATEMIIARALEANTQA
jgi:hypothetical protein